MEKTNLIKGGKADGMSCEDIARKHNVFIGTIKKQLEMGIKVEKEHTPNEAKAKEIAMDHLSEFPDYYTRLEKMEKQGEKDTEAKEQTMADAAGSFEAPAFGDVIPKRKITEMIQNARQKEVKEVAGADISAGAMYDAPIGHKQKDPLAIDEKEKSASITASRKTRAFKDKKFPKFGGPDAKFVEIDSKCKKYPYCNQGNTGVVKLVSEMEEAVKKAAQKYGLTVEQVQEMISKEFQTNEDLPRGIFDDPGNKKAFQSWVNKEKNVDYHIKTAEPIHVVTDDEVEASKLMFLFNRLGVNYESEEIKK